MPASMSIFHLNFSTNLIGLDRRSSRLWYIRTFAAECFDSFSHYHQKTLRNQYEDLGNAKHSNYLIRKYGGYQTNPSGVLLELKLDYYHPYIHTKDIQTLKMTPYLLNA